MVPFTTEVEFSLTTVPVTGSRPMPLVLVPQPGSVLRNIPLVKQKSQSIVLE